jgi:D-lactate dehydrogenase (cytochrome)
LEKRLIHPMDEAYHHYLQDESKMMGAAESISFPENETQICKVLRVMKRSQTPITIQGGKTGVNGSAVPVRGHIMNLSNMNKVKSFFISRNGEPTLKVEPGITLLDLRKAINRLEAQEPLFWPPDPSEPTATVGGIASTAAKGICAHLYGDTRSYISGLRVITAEGSIRDIKTGKSAIFLSRNPIDLLDVYVGGEGMYGIITELSLRLIPKPREIWGIGFFLEDRGGGLSFADHLRDTFIEVEGAGVAAMEYLDRTTFAAIEKHRHHMTKLKSIPEIETNMSSMVYVEIHGEREDSIQALAQVLMKAFVGFNGIPRNTWAFSGEHETEKMRNLLHAAVETAILHTEKIRLTDHRIAKLGVDMSLEAYKLKDLLARLENELLSENLTANFLGHIGSGSLHMDILPRNYREYARGKVLLEKWSEELPTSLANAIAMYGIGKLKQSIFLKTVPKADIEKVMQLKRQLDKPNLWNPGNMIEML